MARRALLPLLALAIGTQGCADLPSVRPLCDQVEPMALLAQSAPDAHEVPCLDEIPFGFRATTFDVGSDEGVWHLSHQVAGLDVLRVRLDEECRSFDPEVDLTGQRPPVGEWSRLVLVEDEQAYAADWLLRGEETCITATVRIDDAGWDEVLEGFEPHLRTISRGEISQALEEESGGRLHLEDHRDDQEFHDGEEAS